MGGNAAGRDELTRAEVLLLYAWIVASGDKERSIIWQSELLENSPILETNIPALLEKFGKRTGLVHRAPMPGKSVRAYLWTGTTSIKDFLMGKLKNRKVLRLNPGWPDRPGCSPEEILKKLIDREEKYGVPAAE